MLPARLTVILLQICLALLVVSVSKVGIFTSEAITEQLEKGYVDPDLDTATTQETGLLGTIGSMAAVGATLLLLRTLPALPSTLRLVLAIEVYIVLSALWSAVFGATLFQATKDTIYLFAAFTLFSSLHTNSFKAAVQVVAATVVLASFALAASNPIFATSLGAEGMRGLFSHKNGFASFCVNMLLLLWPFCFFGSGRLLNFCVCLTLYIGVWMSNGTTGIILATFYLSATSGLMAITNLQRPASFRVVRDAALVCLICIILPTIIVLVASGQLTFTGRTQIWRYFLGNLGWSAIPGMGGYTLKLDDHVAHTASFFIGNSSPDSSWVLIIYNWGVAGIALYLALIRSALSTLSRNVSPYSMFGLFGLFAYVAYGAMESDAHFGANLSLICMLFQLFIAQRQNQQSAI